MLILMCCGSVKKTKKSTSKSTVHVRDFHREVVSVKQPHSGLRHSPAAGQQPWSHHVPTVRSCCEERGTHITSLTSPHLTQRECHLSSQHNSSLAVQHQWTGFHFTCTAKGGWHALILTHCAFQIYFNLVHSLKASDFESDGQRISIKQKEETTSSALHYP